MNPHQVTVQFEQAVSRYTGAPYVVAVNSCTSALFLALKWFTQVPGIQSMIEWNMRSLPVSVPKRTYVSVPMQVVHAGFGLEFRDENWLGLYQLPPLPVWDSARWFSSGMYKPGQFMCVSFHATKTLGIEQGGAILHDSAEADKWFRRARFDGRTQGVPPAKDTFDMLGWHCYMNPSTAAQGLMKLNGLPLINAPLPNDDYPDLSLSPVFKEYLG